MGICSSKPTASLPVAFSDDGVTVGIDLQGRVVTGSAAAGEPYAMAGALFWENLSSLPAGNSGEYSANIGSIGSVGMNNSTPSATNGAGIGSGVLGGPPGATSDLKSAVMSRLRELHSSGKHDITLTYARMLNGKVAWYRASGWPLRRGGALSGFVLHEVSAVGADVGALSSLGSHNSNNNSNSNSMVTAMRRAPSAQDKIMRYAINELLNAMHALSASSNSVKDSLGDVSGDIRQDLQDITFAAHNTQVLVNDILTMNKLRDGSLVSAPELVSIRQALKECIAHVRPIAKSPIILSVASSLPAFLNIDVTSISQMLSNALVLAAKYTVPGGEPIHVIACKEPNSSVGSLGAGQGKIMLEVLDAGAAGMGGMSGDQLMEALVVPEERVVRGARAQRMALFLPIAKMLADTMSGSVTAEEIKAHSAQGTPASVTRFCITAVYTEPMDSDVRRMRDEMGGSSAFKDDMEGINTSALQAPFCYATKSPQFKEESSPVRAASISSNTSSSAPWKTAMERNPSNGAPAADSESRSSARRGRPKTVIGLDGHPLNMHVLLVDDSGVIRRQGENFLEQLGCTCCTLEDGDQVQSALESSARPFDAILMDIVMHRSDGALVCQDLRGRLGVKCPIIAMTGNTKSSDMQRYYAMGFDVVLPKPFTRDSLGRVLVEGRERRGGNTRFARMAAHGAPLSSGVEGSPPEPGAHYEDHAVRMNMQVDAQSTGSMVAMDPTGGLTTSGVTLRVPQEVSQRTSPLPPGAVNISRIKD